MMKEHVSGRQRGFSLLEALVAISIIMIVSGMAIMNFSSVIPNPKANSAMDQVLSQLRSARAKAISHRCEVQIQLVGTNQITISEIARKVAPPPPTTVSFECGTTFMIFPGVPDIPAPFNFGNAGPIVFGGS